MATFLFASTPLYGHVAPLIAAARHLAEAGHRVIMLTGSRFAEAVTAAGLEFEPLPGRADFDERDLAAYLPDMDRYRGVALSQYQLQHTFIHPMAEQWAGVSAILDRAAVDTVVVDHLFAGVVPLLTRPRGRRPAVAALGIGPLAQLTRDAAPAGMALAPSSTPLGRLRNRALNLLVTKLVFRPTQQLARRRYLEATGTPLPADFPFILDLSGRFDRLLQLGPREFEYPLSDLAPGVRFVGALDTSRSREAPPLPAWWPELDDGRAIVHVTQGTVDNGDFSSLVRPTLDGLAGFDGHVVVSTGGAPIASLGELPSNARAAEFLPYDLLLPRLGALVTNGGYGTVLLALRQGVPLVVAPGAEDKPEVAARVDFFGVGVNLRTARPTPDAVGDAVRAVVDGSGHRERAQAIAEAMRRVEPLELIREELESITVGGADSGGR
ncbi:glycosyltransferase [Homoserinibacter sp. YIM 151385]|uniref:glycosyltransferase n=1 Tax=Homoserinibacter sp. YIM 151385 TaxID=2985506 RepID=UPI0022F083D8|nr:nucleotide disphospho-sugar-binding domain-containing protein [Homoserinibacter sp. YIM 151385]WBU39248.1 glycosyltransferase [Homoserinibacter sp. YIM 151385]